MTSRWVRALLFASAAGASVLSGCGHETGSPSPSAAPAVSPDLVCATELTTSVTVAGDGFAPMPNDVLQDHTKLILPSITLTRVQSLEGAGVTDAPVAIPDDANDPAASHVRWTSPQSMNFDVFPGLALQTGLYDVVVTNPDGVGKARFPAALAAVAAPEVKAVSPDILCSEESDQTVTVSGTNMLMVGATVPVARVGSLTIPATSLSDCADVPGVHVEGRVQLCKSATFVIPKGGLKPGNFDVAIENPSPAGCKSSPKVSLAVVPAPVVSALVPPAICDDQSDQVLGITGTGFLQIGAALPEVVLGAVKLVPTSLGGCSPVGTYAEGAVQSCTMIAIKVAKGTFAPGDYPLVITNPAPANCKTLQTVSLHDEPPPTVTKVTPATLCQGGGPLTIDGSGFLPTPTVTLTAANQPNVVGSGTMINPAGTQLTTTVGAGTVPGTTYDVLVANPDGCGDSAPHQQVFIKPGPVLFLADPEVVYGGINMSVTVYVAGANYSVNDVVTIVPTGQVSPATTLVTNGVGGHPNRFQAVIPKGQAAGAYDLIWTPQGGCGGVMTKAITVTQSLTVTMLAPPKGVVSPFGWTKSDTAVTIKRDAAALAPGDHKFFATPRAFLYPNNAQNTDLAVSLGSVGFIDSDTLTAVVPKGLKAQSYDLVVADPDGAVGYLAKAFTVTANAPPIVSAASPSSIVAATNQQVTLSGTDFRVGAVVSMTCQDANANVYAAPAVVGAVTCGQNGCSLPVTIDASAVGGTGPFCLVRLTNTDGTYGDYSAIGITNNSLNLEKPPAAGASMIKARRALVASAVNASSVARFIYAIGGDSGTAGAAAPFNTSEFVSVDLYGKMGAWKTQKYDIGGARSFAGGARLGLYTYLVGGFDGAGNLATARRAMTLNPAEVPALDVDDIVLSQTGLDAGYWFYKVSAVFANSDADNPGGESLTSDEFIVKLPAIGGKKCQIKLVWSAPVDSLGVALPNVASYRVYRTPVVNGVSGGEQLIASPSTANFTDDGSASANVAEVPLPVGSMGKWAVLPNMAVARKGASSAIATDPVTPSVSYLYAGLGLNASNAVITGYEYLSVTTAPNGHQTVGVSWKAGANAVTANGRWQAGAWVADSKTSSVVVAPSNYVYFGGGIDAANVGVKNVEVGKVAAGGDLGVIAAATKSFSGTLAGYGVCAANNQLFTFGGANAGPSSGATAASIASPAPNLNNSAWNSEGLTLNQSRYLMGSTVQSAFIFLVGGDTGGGVATNTTETILW